jgi:undecaprenyl-diphosphatase
MIDLLIFEKINKFAGKWRLLDALGIFFAEYLGYILILILILFLIKDYKKYWKMVLESFSAAILARLGFAEIIRFFWHRSRPFVEHQVSLILKHDTSPSFPSGHASFYFAISTIVYSYNKKVGLIFFLASFLISISRVFCGIHWPSDVLGGALIGIFSGWLILKLTKKFS